MEEILSKRMKLSKIISIIGWLLIFSGLTLFLFENIPEQEYKIETKTYINPKYKLCLMEALWYEARGISYYEKELILDVIINRSNSNIYPKDICKVIQQPMQFSYRNHLKNKSKIILPRFQSLNTKSDREAYLQIEEIVNNRLSSNSIRNKILPDTAMWYHLKGINKPNWTRSKNIKEVKKDVDKNIKHRYYMSK